MWSNP